MLTNDTIHPVTTVTYSANTGESPATFTVPVRVDGAALITIMLDRIESAIRHLWHFGAEGKIADINAIYAEIVGQIRLITLATDQFASDTDSIVYYLRKSAIEARDRALARRKRRLGA